MQQVFKSEHERKRHAEDRESVTHTRGTYAAGLEFLLAVSIFRGTGLLFRFPVLERILNAPCYESLKA